MNRVARHWSWLSVGAVLFLVWLLALDGVGLPGSVTAVTRPIITDDLKQTRLDTPLQTPQGSLTISQSFIPRWDGLQAIELMFARSSEPTVEENGRIHLQLFDDNNALVTERELNTQTISHNQIYTFRFAPQPHAAGRQYSLNISGSKDNPVTVWGYSLDVYAQGELWLDGGPLATAVPTANAQELRFITRTQLTWNDAFIALGTMLWKDGLIMLLALFLLPMPGLILLLTAEGINRKGHKDRQAFFLSLRPLRFKNPLAWWGIAFALGTAVWPLLWQFMTLLGGRWRGWSLWLLFVTGWLAILLFWWEQRRRFTPALRLPGSATIILVLLLTLTTATRLLAVRDLSFPPWVDASRHGLITAVMSHSGQLPGSYEPYLPVTAGEYHYGFHAISASLALMTGWSLNRLLLFVGQLIGGLMPLTVYTAVILMTRRQRAGLLAAFLAGLPFFFPGYYATWGRLTQLTAMFIMPVLLALTWLLLRGGRAWRRGWWLVALLAAGLFLIHFRVFVFYLPFAAVVWLSARGRNGRWLAAAGGLSLLLVASRIGQLIAITEPRQLVSNPIPNYNAFPTGYVQTGWEQSFLWLALAALLPTFLLSLRRRWTWLPLALTGWTAVLFIIVGGDRLGLPSTSVVNLNSLYITFFLPLAIFMGVIADQLWIGRARLPWLLQSTSGIAAGSILMATFLFGIRQQISILNDQTLLAQHADVAGLDWVTAHVPETAVFAVSSWKWLGETWAGSDGGAWLVPLTGRMSTTPPIDHIYNRDLFQFVREFNATATAVTDWGAPGQAVWLHQQGVTHIFVGQRGGYFDPAALARNPQMQIVYGRDGVFVFEINGRNLE